MKVGAEDKRKQTIAIALFVVAAGLVGYNLFSGPSSTPPPPAAPVVLTAGAKSSGPAAAKVGATSAQLDPTLQMGPMLVTENLVYTGTGRNIFSGEMEAEAVVEPPKPVAPPRPVQVATGPVKPPTPPQPSGPPPVNLKFFGTSTSMNGTRKAFLLNGDDVFVASVGDVVNRRYRIVSIAAASILVEDIPNTNKQTLPLVGN